MGSLHSQYVLVINSSQKTLDNQQPQHIEGSQTMPLALIVDMTQN